MTQIQQYVAKRIYDSKWPNDIIYKRFQDTEMFYSINGGSIGWRTEEYLLRECERKDDYWKIEPVVEPQEEQEKDCIDCMWTGLSEDEYSRCRACNGVWKLPKAGEAKDTSEGKQAFAVDHYWLPSWPFIKNWEGSPKVAVGTDTDNQEWRIEWSDEQIDKYCNVKRCTECQRLGENPRQFYCPHYPDPEIAEKKCKECGLGKSVDTPTIE